MQNQPQMWNLASEYIEPPDEDLYEDPGPQPHFRFSWETVTSDDLMAASSVNRARMFRPVSLLEPAATSQDSQGMGHVSASFQFPQRRTDGAHKGSRPPPLGVLDHNSRGHAEAWESLTTTQGATPKRAEPKRGMDPSIPVPKAAASPKERSMSVLPPLSEMAVRVVESRAGPRSKSHPVLTTIPASPKTPAAPRRSLVSHQQSGGVRGRNPMPSALPVLVQVSGQ